MTSSMLTLAAVLAATSPHVGPGPKVEYENEDVTVIRLRIAPRQKIPMHDVTPRVVVWLTDARLRLTFPDGSTKDQAQRAGDTEWLPRQRHAGENLGDAPIELVAVIPKAR